MRPIIDSLRRPDVRRNPPLAVLKRIWWKIRWFLNQQLFRTRLFDGTPILGAKTGSTALIYYQGVSEPETMLVYTRYLKSGMVVFDVGAHIGEYTVVAAEKVGPRGKVYAFEPQPELVDVIQKNIQQRGFQNVIASAQALSDQSGTAAFRVPTERTKAALETDSNVSPTYEVSLTTIDDYCLVQGISQIDLIKMDIEGAELWALKGAANLLSQPSTTSPIIIFEYNQQAYQRFGYTIDDIQGFLTHYQYFIYTFDEKGHYHPFSATEIKAHRCNLIASKVVILS